MSDVWSPVNTDDGWQKEVAALRQRAEQAERLLCDLTPGGSEFAGSPQRCVDWVQERLHSSLVITRDAVIAKQQAERERDEWKGNYQTALDAAVENQRQLAECQAANAAMRAALEDARHALTTLNGLWATDNVHAYDDALANGADANAAHDCIMDNFWQIDEAKTLATIDAALGLKKEAGKDV